MSVTILLLEVLMTCIAEELSLLPGVHLQLHSAVLHHFCHLPGRVAADQQVEVSQLWHCHPQGTC